MVGNLVRVLSAIALLSLGSCGGGDSGTSGGGTTLPSPTPTPIPSPTPTPTPTSVTISYLHTFMPGATDGGQPNGPLLLASDGNLYGTTRAGGENRCSDLDNFCGVVFRMTPSGQVAVLHSFGANATDGTRPLGALMQGADGAIYGLTAAGGVQNGGTAWRLTLGGEYRVMHSFTGVDDEGYTPVGGLVQTADGNFYGVTDSGGRNHCAYIPSPGGNCGTVFQMDASGKVTTLYSFGGSTSDGSQPTGPLLIARDGNLYGTTTNGGSCVLNGVSDYCGTIFRIARTGAYTVLHRFGTSLADDGIAPQGPLIQANDGMFYGTTAAGGLGRCGGTTGCGTVYRMTASGTVSLLHAFSVDSRADGYGPGPFLVQGKDGNLYGVTGSGGTYQSDLLGTIFRLTPSGAKTTLHSFGPYDAGPHNPVGGLVQVSDGSFFGVTAYQGPNNGAGTVFRAVLQ